MTPSIHRSERLLNLLIALWHTQVPMSKQQIRASVNGYQQAKNDAAFERMFERDKKDLRDLGFPLESHVGDLHEDEHGYRLDIANYELPPLHLTPAQMSVLMLATELWNDAETAVHNRNALTKLRAVGPDADREAIAALSVKQASPESHLLTLLDAAAHRQVVSFTYRSAHSGQLRRREVEPWRIFSQYGGWYLFGFDRDAQDHRTFRLSRITGTVEVGQSKGDFDVPQPLPATTQPPELTAKIWVREQQAWQLRRRGTIVGTAPTSDGSHWDIVQVTYHEEALLADEVAALGTSALIYEPESLQQAVRARLVAAADFNTIPQPQVDVVVEETTAQEKTTSILRETATERLVRLLALIAYLEDAGAQPVSALAEHFGVSERQIIKDIDTLWVSGTPGYGPEDLIDFSAGLLEERIVKLEDSRKMNKPVRLSHHEAFSLLAALHAMQTQEGVVNSELLQSTMDALFHVIHQDVADVRGVLSHPGTVPPRDQAMADLLREAIHQQHQVTMVYLSSLDERTERMIDPWRIRTDGRATYITAWCHRAKAPRDFRIDRIESAHMEATPIAVPEPAAPGMPYSPLAGEGSSREEPVLPVLVTLEPWARFLAETYESRMIAEYDDGSFTLGMEAHSAEWVSSLLLGHALAVRELAPAQVAERIATRAQHTLEFYETHLGLSREDR